MAWYHEVLNRATDKELSDAVADTFLPDFTARIVRAIGDEQQRRIDIVVSRVTNSVAGSTPYGRCEAQAVRSTGSGMWSTDFGMCERPLDRNGQCDRAGQHVTEAPKIKIVWTSHGHYAKQGEPTKEELAVRPQLVARCGGPGMCTQCSLEAGRA